MTEEQINTVRYYAACDIAHRWFAFFEGITEEIHEHSDIFTEDVQLVHAGTHLLAKGKADIIQWLRSLPHEKGSHFIRSINMTPVGDNEADVDMDISYQMVDAERGVGGALSEYKTRMRFDRKNNAQFSFIQKTPRFANPDKFFRESFAINRLYSFIARFSQLLTTSPDSLTELLNKETDTLSLRVLETFQKGIESNSIKLLSYNLEQLKCNFMIHSSGMHQTLELTLQEAPGRYMTIIHATITAIPVSTP